MSQVEARLKELYGIDLPEAPAPVADYAPYVIAGNLIYISGQLSKSVMACFEGALNDNDTDIEKGQRAAQLCAVNILAQAKSALVQQGLSLDDIRRVVRLGGFVNSGLGMARQPEVINGASKLMNRVFADEKGLHSRAAVSASALPFNVCVEIDAIIEFAA